tara:strand:+ start:108 stop:626 length:519 start_codon:yes stop_codon:yes gene_type:complete
MPCVLTTGFAEQCEDGLGGIQAGEFLVGRLDEIDTYTVVAGEVTALTQVAATDFYRYWMKKETANAVITTTVENGNQISEAVITAMIQKLSNIKNTEFKLLAGKPNVIIYKDNNGVYFIAGLEKGADLNSRVAQTGATMNDSNGYTLTFTARSGNAPYSIDSTVVGGLSIAV